MDRVTKEAQVNELKDKLGRVTSIVLADYRGLDVPTVTGLRDEFRKVQCEYKVFKNTLVKLAIKGTKLEGMSQVPRGPDGDDLLLREPIGAGQGGHQVRQGPGEVRRQGRLLRGQVLDAKGVESLATMPGKDELRAKLLATFMAPATDLVRTLSAGAQNFMYLLSAKERAGGGD